MLLAAYTTSTNVESTSHLTNLENALGYKPIFCFKAENAREAIINSILASPHAPEKLVIFEGTPDNKIDYVQWNRYRADQNTDVTLEDCFTAQDDLYQLMLVKKIENIVIEIDIKKSFFITENIDKQNWSGFLADVISSSQTCAINLCQNIKPMLAVDVPIEAYDHAAKLIMKEGFQYFILPLFYPIILNRQLSYSTYFNYKKYMNTVTVNKIARLCNPDESMTDKTYKKFEEILKDLRDATDKTYDQVLSDGFNGYESEKGPNTMCSCGSGKKYKKCCKNTVLERL